MNYYLGRDQSEMNRAANESVGNEEDKNEAKRNRSMLGSRAPLSCVLYNPASELNSWKVFVPYAGNKPVSSLCSRDQHIE